MTQPCWKVTNAWNKKYMLLQAAHWWKCMLPTGPKPKEKTHIEHSIGLTGGTEEDRFKGTSVEHTSNEEGNLILHNWQNFVIHQGAFYLHSMPKGETEDLLLFVVPKAHCVTSLNGCHWDAGHQGHDQTLSLLQEHFLWPGMASQM